MHSEQTLWHSYVLYFFQDLCRRSNKYCCEYKVHIVNCRTASNVDMSENAASATVTASTSGATATPAPMPSVSTSDRSEKNVPSSNGSGSNSSPSGCLGGNKRGGESSACAAQGKKGKVGIEHKLLQAFESQQEDLETSFCLSLVDQLRRMDACTQGITKLKIQQLMFDAEFSSEHVIRNSWSNGAVSQQVAEPHFHFKAPYPPPHARSTGNGLVNSGLDPVPSNPPFQFKAPYPLPKDMGSNGVQYQNQPVYDVVEYHRQNAEDCQSQ